MEMKSEMNWLILKDFKTMFGFVVSNVFAVTSIILASSNNDYWVFFVFLALIFMFFSTYRADKLYRQNNV